MNRCRTSAAPAWSKCGKRYHNTHSAIMGIPMSHNAIATFESAGFGWRHTWTLYDDHVESRVVNLWFIKKRREVGLCTLLPNTQIWILHTYWFLGFIGIYVVSVAYWLASFILPGRLGWPREEFLVAGGISGLICLLTAIGRTYWAGIAGFPPIHIRFQSQRRDDVEGFISVVIAQIKINIENS